MFRRILDACYRLAALLAAACLAAVGVLVLAQIVGRWFGVIVPSAEDFAGFLLAASTFLALAYTLRSGGHIRVTLLLHRLPPRLRRGFELAVLIVALLLAGYAAWACVLLVVESWRIGEVSSGYVPVPLWIPQLPMAAGLAIFAVALLDELIRLLRGGAPEYLRHEDADTAAVPTGNN